MSDRFDLGYDTRTRRITMRFRLVFGLLTIVPAFLLTYLPWRIYRAIKATSPGQAPAATLKAETRAFGRFLKDWPRAFRTGTPLQLHDTNPRARSGSYQGWSPRHKEIR